MPSRSLCVKKKRADEAPPDLSTAFGPPSLTFTIPATGETWNVHEPDADAMGILHDGDWVDPGDGHDAVVVVLWNARAIVASASACWGEIGAGIGSVVYKLDQAAEEQKEASNVAA